MDPGDPCLVAAPPHFGVNLKLAGRYMPEPRLVSREAAPPPICLGI